jgi:hypothetical protein
MRTMLLDDDNQLVRAHFLLFVSTILLLAGGLYGELYERPYHKVLFAADLGPPARRRRQLRRDHRCEKGARLSLVPPLLRTIKLGWR